MLSTRQHKKTVELTSVEQPRVERACAERTRVERNRVEHRLTIRRFGNLVVVFLNVLAPLKCHKIINIERTLV